VEVLTKVVFVRASAVEIVEARVLVVVVHHSSFSRLHAHHVARHAKYLLSQMAKSLSTARNALQQMAVLRLAKVAMTGMSDLLHAVISIDLVPLSDQM
jgi:hypothetical protein